MSRKNKYTDSVKQSPTFKSWLSMKDRKNQSKNLSYIERNITVSPEWKKSFFTFLADMGERPPGKTLDRIDNDGHYCKGNCRWASPKEQARNRSSNVKLQYEGKTYLLVELAEKFNIPQKLLRTRIFKYKWPVEKAIELWDFKSNKPLPKIPLY